MRVSVQGPCRLFVLWMCVGVLLVCSPCALSTPSVAELKAQAEAGNQVAQHQLVEFLIFGGPSAPGYNEAVAWLRAFAVKNADAQLLLGYLYDQGRGVARDSAKAAECYEAAANRGSVVAANNLAYHYEQGLGVEKNPGKAFDLYLASAKRGNASAQYNLANLYIQGLGAPRDYFQAAKWFEVAAKQGHAFAQHDLGMLYSGGLGVARDDAQGATWIKLAAAQHYAVAERDLGRLYEVGKGVGLDYVQAYVWYSRAMAEGDNAAGSLRKELSQVMTVAQVERAKSMLRTEAAVLEQRGGARAASPCGVFPLSGH